MKKFFTILLSLFSLMAYPQWSWVNPQLFGFALNDIHFVNDNVGYAVGNKGTVMKSTNAGETWQLMPQTIFNNFELVWFCTEDTGYVSSNGGVMYKTMDGGISWIENGTGMDEEITDLFFHDQQTGVIVTHEGSIYKTVNGGVSWTRKASSYWEITSVSFANKYKGIATGMGGKYYTTSDGGDFWIEHSVDFNLWNVAYTDEYHVFMSGQGGAFMRSTNGGSSWTTFDCGVSLDKMTFIDEHTGYALTSSEYLFIESHHLYKTTDGGTSWTILDFDKLKALHVRGNGSLVVAGRNGRLLTIEADTLAKNHNPSITDGDFFKLQMPSADTGYAVAYRNTIIKSTDAGNTWHVLPHEGLPYNRSGAWFTDNHTGYVTSDSSVYKTTDGGSTWNQILIPSSGDLTKLYFIDKLNGYVIDGFFGKVFRTDDAGATWYMVYENYYGNLKSIQFLDKDTGFVASYSSIFKTVDGGITWSETLIESYATLMDMHFVNSQIGYLCGHSSLTNCNIVYKTLDGGQNWISYPIVGSYTMGTSIHFIDENLGFLACTGDFFQTSDGGQSWINIPYIEGDFESLCFTSDTTGFVTGYSGIILKTTNAGSLPVSMPEYPVTEFTLYPNPATDAIALRSMELSGPVNIKIYSVKGQSVLDKTYNRSSCEIDISKFPRGLYIMRINTLTHTEVKKFVIN